MHFKKKQKKIIISTQSTNWRCISEWVNATTFGTFCTELLDLVSSGKLKTCKHLMNIQTSNGSLCCSGLQGLCRWHKGCNCDSWNPRQRRHLSNGSIINGKWPVVAMERGRGVFVWFGVDMDTNCNQYWHNQHGDRHLLPFISRPHRRPAERNTLSIARKALRGTCFCSSQVCTVDGIGVIALSRTGGALSWRWRF